MFFGINRIFADKYKKIKNRCSKQRKALIKLGFGGLTAEAQRAKAGGLFDTFRNGEAGMEVPLGSIQRVYESFGLGESLI